MKFNSFNDITPEMFLNNVDYFAHKNERSMARLKNEFCRLVDSNDRYALYNFIGQLNHCMSRNPAGVPFIEEMLDLTLKHMMNRAEVSRMLGWNECFGDYLPVYDAYYAEWFFQMKARAARYLDEQQKKEVKSCA